MDRVDRGPHSLWPDSPLKRTYPFRAAAEPPSFVVWVQGTREEEESTLESQKIPIRFGQINSNLLVVRPHRRTNILEIVIPWLFFQSCASADFAASRRSAERLRFCGRLVSMKPAHYAEGAWFAASRPAPTAHALSPVSKNAWWKRTLNCILNSCGIILFLNLLGMQISMYIASFLIRIGRYDTERVKSTVILRISFFLNTLLCCLFTTNLSYSDTHVALI